MSLSRSAELTQKTIADFGEQWLAFTDSPGYYGSVELLADIFGPLLSVGSLKGLRVAEIGSGAGRIVHMLIEAGAARVVAVEPSDAITILQQNTASMRDQITYIHDTGDRIPADLDLDLVLSIGVLHHIPDPLPVLRAMRAALRPGGQVLVWIYGLEGNEAYLRFALPLRKLTTHLPHRALVALSAVIAAALDVYIGACRILPLPLGRYMREVLGRFPRAARRLTVYDQLNPRYAKYYRKEEIEELLTAAAFVDVQLYHRHAYSWTAMARKPPLI